jgi:Tfp pilus assembly protein PilO
MTQRDRIVVAVVGAVAVLAAYWLLLLGPRREEATKLNTQVEAAQARVSDANTKLTTVKAAKAAYGQELATIARLGKAVPADDDMPSLVYQLENAARHAGIDFRAVKIEGGSTSPAAAAATATNAAPGTMPGPAGLTQLPFRLTFQGGFLDLRRFLDLVNSFAKPNGAGLDIKGRLLTVDAVSLVPAQNDFSKVKAQVVANAYIAPAPQTTTAATGTATPGSATAATGAAAPSGSTTPPATVGGLLP